MTRTFWLSFHGDADQFLGACVVDVTDEDAAQAKAFATQRFPGARPGSEWLGAAIRKAHVLSCNPGGDVAGLEITHETSEIIMMRAPRNRLLSVAEIEALDAVADESGT